MTEPDQEKEDAVLRRMLGMKPKLHKDSKLGGKAEASPRRRSPPEDQ